MKKMILFGSIIIVLFVAIFVVTKIEEKNDSTKQKIESNTSSKKSDADYYTNKISLVDLQRDLAEKKEEIVYFYQTSCVHCQKLSPIIVPMAKDLHIDMKVMDIEELDTPWYEYKIAGTPTIIYFKDGKESKRISGNHSSIDFKKWFEQIKTE